MMHRFFTIRPEAPPRAVLEQWYSTSPLGKRLREQLNKDMGVILDQWFGYNLLVIGPNTDIPIS